MVGDFEHTKEYYGKNRNHSKEPDKTKGFTHDSKNRVVDGLRQIAGGLNGVANAHTSHPTSTDGEHGVVNVVGGIGAFLAG